MNGDCGEFRTALEAELLGRPARNDLSGLAWHGHLLACGECRDLLEKEEALEMLLASLPVPRLPAPIQRRVLARLRELRSAETRLEALLDLDAESAALERAPESLAKSVLAGLARERGREPSGTSPIAAQEARLDALLDADRAVEAPPGLALRVLEALAAARRVRLPERTRPAARVARSWVYAAAAGIALLLLGRAAWLRTRAGPAPGSARVAEAGPEPDPAMLAALDVLEEWDLLMQDDVDVLLSTVTPADEALLDYP